MVLPLRQQGFLREIRAACIQHDIAGKVQDFLEGARRYVQYEAHTARYALEIPYMRYRSSQLDMAHALTAHFSASHLDAAAVAYDALIADALVLAAVAFPVAGWSEYALAEQAVTLRLERTIVYGLRLLYLAVRPLTYLFRRGQADAH